jgi:AraC family transcriptional regulator of adaptative response/methylated-DNA-[protein]-cysteine methyltransferase
MQRAVAGRDASYDGIFFLGVRTTGIFCRPSCPAKKPRPQNVEYFGSACEALLAGYRPCKRCRPMDTNGQSPRWVQQLLTMVERDPAERLTDADLRAAAIDPARARRYFRSHYGMTFQAYHRARRMGLALAQIRRGSDLSDVALAHGFESNSGFRDAFERIFGQPPGKSRAARVAVSTRIESPIGPLVAAATPDGVCLLEFADRRALERQLATLRKRLSCAIVPGRNEHLDVLNEELGKYFEAALTRFTVPLVTAGTPFQEDVWRRLVQIPYGQTLSYSALAREVGRPGAQRAVGRANGDNRLAIVIPCHRVVQADGQLRGYGGGLWRKQFLLDLERRNKPQQSKAAE